MKILFAIIISFMWDELFSFKSMKHKFKIRQFNLSMIDQSKLNVYILNTINGINREEWNKLKGDNPFLEYDWLYAMEKSKCANLESGWDPIHIVIGYQNSTESTTLTALAACPLYIKYHSYGEFIFDQQWASFAEAQLGIKYYPKASITSYCIEIFRKEFHYFPSHFYFL